MVIAFKNLCPAIKTATTYVAPDAVVIGDVCAADRVSIWFGAVIRGDEERITIGEGTNVQDNAVLHTDRGFPMSIGRGVIIGHKAVLHGCTVGDNTLIGINAAVLNGARIGSNCIVGAGAVVPEGMEVPDNAVVLGVPGKIKREITEEEMERIRIGAEHYMRQISLYRE